MSTDLDLRDEDYRRALAEPGPRPSDLAIPDLRLPAERAKLKADLAKLRGHPSDAEGNAFLDEALASAFDDQSSPSNSSSP